MTEDLEERFFQSPQFVGALMGARAGLTVYGIEVDDDIAAQVGVSVLIGFFAAAGFEPASIDRLSRIIAQAVTRREH